LSSSAKDSKARNGIVADGRERVIAVELPRIQREVRARYADQWASTGFLKRIRLCRLIRREIRAKLDRLAPPAAMYLD
jgi:hypothetical protein